MPRIHSVKTTKIYLPSSHSGNADPPTLEVLVMAQKIAKDRGQVFDIEAFMPPEMRDEWLVLTKGRGEPEVKEENGEEDAEKGITEEEVKVEETAATREETVDPTAPATTAEDGAVNEPSGITESQAPNDALPQADGQTAPQTDTAAPPTLLSTTDDATPATTTTETQSAPAPPAKEPFKLHANHPALLNLHWKQRQKRLAQLAQREASIARGEVPEYFPELEALIRGEEEKEKEKEREEEVGQKRKRGLTAADVEGIRASASHWNHLLIEARRARGPQWDYNTQQHLVDRSTPDYYTHMKPPRPDVDPLKLDGQVNGAGPSQPQQQLTNGHGHNHGQATPSSSQSNNRPLPPHRHSQSSSPVKPPQMPIGQDGHSPMPGPERRMSGATPIMHHGQLPPGQGQTPNGIPPNFAQAYNQQHSQNQGMSPHTQQQQQQGMYQPNQQHIPPPQPQPQSQGQSQHSQPPQMQFDPAQFLAFQQHQQRQAQQGQGQGQGPNSNQMMNPAALMQAQQRLQQQAQQQRANGGPGPGPGPAGQGINMAALMAQAQAQGQGQGQGQQQSQWNPNMGMSPAMMQSMGIGAGGGGGMLGAGGGAGWNGGQ